MIIHDGATGVSAEVNSNRQLVTEAHVLSAEANAAKDGDAFTLYGVCHIAAAAAGGLLYFKNTSTTYEVVITRAHFDARTLTDDIIVGLEFEPVRTSGTDISTTGMDNKNSGSAKALEGELYISDGSADMTFASGNEQQSFLVTTLLSFVRDMGDSVIVAPGKIIGWSWATLDAGAGVDAEIISVSVDCYRRL